MHGAARGWGGGVSDVSVVVEEDLAVEEDVVVEEDEVVVVAEVVESAVDEMDAGDGGGSPTMGVGAGC